MLTDLPVLYDSMRPCHVTCVQMMEGCIKQNNGIDIYIEYFENQDEVTQCEVPQTKTVGQSLLVLQTINRRSCTITEKAPTRAFSWLKAPTSAFTFKTLC